MRDKNPPMKRMSEEHVLITQNEIAKRKNKWRLVSLDFDDVAQTIFTRVIKKYHTYDPARSLYVHWINRVISNALRNVLRDNYGKYSRPCIHSCAFNLGGTHCGWTPSGEQCAECPLYRKWQQSKESNFNISQTLSLENHAQEVHAIQYDNFEVESSKKIIDSRMKDKLNHFEYNIYKLIFIDEIDEKKVVADLKAKGTEIQIRKLKEKFVNTAREIINQEDLAI
jgi:hypothetical protein